MGMFGHLGGVPRPCLWSGASEHTLDCPGYYLWLGDSSIGFGIGRSSLLRCLGFGRSVVVRNQGLDVVHTLDLDVVHNLDLDVARNLGLAWVFHSLGRQCSSAFHSSGVRVLGGSCSSVVHDFGEPYYFASHNLGFRSCGVSFYLGLRYFWVT